jgi:hypothetical protein
MSNNALAIADETELAKQTAYATVLKQKNFDYSLAVVGSHFVESMRAIHYKSTGTALNELIDNSIEAGATSVHVALGYFGKSDAKPDAMAIIDDGHGMVSDMIRLSVLWGGTHRGEEKQRKGWGRFGFGLPSASVNQCRRFTVFSSTGGGKWFGVTIDLDDIRDGKYQLAGSFRVVAPEPKEQPLPKWIQSYIEKNMPGGRLEHGSIVIWEKLDRVKWSTTSGMRTNIIPILGVSYYNYLSRVDLRFDGTRVDPIDPLFTTSGFRLFDEDEDRATALPPAEIEIKSKLTGEKAIIRVRYARFPLSFFWKDKAVKTTSSSNSNVRWTVKNMTRGLIVSRMGRMIDVLDSTPWKGMEKFRNDDRYWAVEIDFPADLDEEFSIANNKQDVVLSERVWDILEQSGVGRNIAALRKWVADEQKRDEVEKEQDRDEKRPSEKALEATQKYARTRAGSDPVERIKRARDAFEAHVRGEARNSHQPEETVRAQLEKETKEYPYRVLYENTPGASFFRMEEIGGQKRLFINRAHRFFADVYAAAGATGKVRNAIEVLLFVIGECELDAYANQDRKNFYVSERAAWSERLAHALDDLNKYFAEREMIDTEAA